MPNLLRIDASARSEGSHSRMLGDVFEDVWLTRNIDGQVIRRDLARNAISQNRRNNNNGLLYTARSDDRCLAFRNGAVRSPDCRAGCSRRSAGHYSEATTADPEALAIASDAARKSIADLADEESPQ